MLLLPIPVLLVCLAESALSLLGVGTPTAVFLDRTLDGQRGATLNRAYYENYLSVRLGDLHLWDRQEFFVPAEKAEDCYRIFVFGGSAAKGTPNRAHSFWRVLEAMLETRFPNSRFEIYSLAIGGGNSLMMLPAARACARLDPDLFIIYMGNNEVICPGGAQRSYLRLRDGGRRHLRLLYRMRGTRLAQLLLGRDYKRGPAPWKRPEDLWRFFLREDPESARVQQVYQRFKGNLEATCNAANDSGAQVLLCNVAANCRNWEPLWSEHPKTLSDRHAKDWQAHYETGKRALKQGQPAAALAAFDAALSIDGAHAGLLYRIAKSHLALEHPGDARRYFEAARDADFVQFRANTQINRTIAGVAAEHLSEGVHFVDALSAFQAASPANVAGKEFFLDLVHLNFEGNYLLARTIFERLLQILPERIRSQSREKPAPASIEACAERLAVTPFVLRGRTQGMLNFVRFIGHLSPREMQGVLEERIETLTQGTSEAELVGRQFEAEAKALAAFGPDFFVYESHASRLRNAGRIEEALEVARRLVRDFPKRRGSHHSLAAALEAAGSFEEASAVCRQTVAMHPDDYEAYTTLGRIAARQGRVDDAVAAFRRALRLEPYIEDARFGAVAALESEGRHEEAVALCVDGIDWDPQWPRAFEELEALLAANHTGEENAAQWRRLVKGYPDAWLSHYYLGRALRGAGDPTAARGAFARAAQLNPKATEVLQAIEELAGQS